MNGLACKACGAPIVWIRMRSGKAMPCDAFPVYYVDKHSGTKRVVLPNGEVISCEYTDNSKIATGTGFVPHWSTCPKADLFRVEKEAGRR